MRDLTPQFKLLLSGLLLLCLLQSLAGCTTTQLLAPPDDLLADCAKTSYPVQTNGDLARLAKDRGDDLDRCNADKKALREWAAKGRKGPATLTE